MAIQKPEKALIVRFRINKTYIKNLTEAGIRFLKRTKQHDKKIEQKHVESAKAQGRDPYRGKRKDAIKVKRADSGVPVWSWGPNGNPNVTLSELFGDIYMAFGFRITDIHMSQKPGEWKMGFLYVTFSGEEPVDISEKAEEILSKLACSCYQYLHAFRNDAEGTWTFNPSHRIQFEQLPETMRVLRLDKDGHVRTTVSKTENLIVA